MPAAGVMRITWPMGSPCPSRSVIHAANIRANAANGERNEGYEYEGNTRQHSTSLVDTYTYIHDVYFMDNMHTRDFIYVTY